MGGLFTAWDGYITGSNRELLEGRRIVQAWRTTEFPKESPDSLLTVYFDPEGEGTHLTLVHYVTPLQTYFKGGPAKKAAKKPVAKKAASKKPVAKKKPAKKKAKR